MKELVEKYTTKNDSIRIDQDKLCNKKLIRSSHREVVLISPGYICRRLLTEIDKCILIDMIEIRHKN